MKKSVKKKPRKKSKARLAIIERNKLLRDWARRCKDTYGYACEKCGCKHPLNCHHLITKRRWKEHQYDVGVGIVLCAGCHLFRPDAAHQDSFGFLLWFKNKFPERYNYCVQLMEKGNGECHA